MKYNTQLKKNGKYRFIRHALKKRYDRETLLRILSRAETHYAALAAQCGGATPGEWKHLNNTILPTAAVYLGLKDVDPDNAWSAAREALIGLCETGGRVVGAMLRIPGMKGLFMKLLPKMALSMFGRECGFDYENFSADKKSLTMDTLACPYCRYAALLEVEELMPVFCESDFATYGKLPGIRFERTATLGTGGDRCDFRFTRE